MFLFSNIDLTFLQDFSILTTSNEFLCKIFVLIIFSIFDQKLPTVRRFSIVPDFYYNVLVVYFVTILSLSIKMV